MKREFCQARIQLLKGQLWPLGAWHGVTGGTSQEETQMEGKTLVIGVEPCVHVSPLT